MLANIGPSSVIRPVVISWKLSKIDQKLLWNTIQKLDRWFCCHIHIPRPSPGKYCFSIKYIQILIRPPVRLGVRRKLFAIEHDRRHTAGIVNCCKQSAMVGICCPQSSSVVLTNLTTPKSNRRRACIRCLIKTMTNRIKTWNEDKTRT